VASLKFLSDWSFEQDGDIRPGEALSIEYDVKRLPRCRASRYGRDTWSIIASIRFHPNGQEKDDPVVAVKNSGATVAAPLTVAVPSDATKIELWFKNTDSNGCVDWDSRYGRNYWFDVTPA
jgi:hypothetical protein